ncbi:RHS repeat-associated core domain-containing protein [Akkermansia sp.]|uniref:RHS repeat-associated core domain-containing protein n=1 Tax=Akkermansia sp. TaxID=1872421 RepID=UPI0025BBB46E|nr:RHS repeat-associated core domain-containing protein [Akkermansia sp.]MCC8147580.1 sugar-binding protein [Akkermansia sp.]
MSISRKNSFAPNRPLGFTVAPFQPVNKDSTPAARAAAGGDMIELSYSHGKPSTSADVMTPIRRAFELAEQPGGGKHTVTASGRVDDSVSVKVDGTKKESSSGSAHNFSLTFENLSPGLHCLNVKHNNINYYPEPTGNVSLINGTVGPCPPVTIIPGENAQDNCECPCAAYDDEGGGGGSSSSSRSSSRTGLPLRLASPSSGGSSSAGRGIVRAATLQYMRWAASFGAFRGMGGIPGGRLELTGYDGYAASLLTPAALAYRHPAASAVLVPDGGIVPNSMFRVYEGGGYFNYVCDAEGTEAFGVGSTSSDTKRVQFVTALSREESSVTTLDAAGYLRVAKTDGSAAFYNLTTGEFEGYISSKNSLLTAQQAESCLAVLRQEDGTLRQLWNLWDGLADIVPAADGTGYTVSLYLPGQVTGIDETTGLYTVTGDPFKSFTIGGDSAEQTLTVTERDWTLPSSVSPLTATWSYANSQWSLTLGEGNEAVATTKERIELEEEGSYRILTTVSKGEATASITAEDYLSHPVGELLLARTEGFGTPEARTTAYEYDDAGRLISVTAPDGGKTTYLHDDANRVVITTTPWAGGKSRLVQTTYLDDGSEYSNELKKVEENLVLASGSVKLLRRDMYTYSVAGHVKRVEKRSTANSITRLEVSETWQGSAENIHARGRTRMTQEAGGIQTWYDYAATTDHGALYAVTAETRVEGETVPGQSTRNVSYITAEGNTVREEHHLLDSAGTWRLLSAADYEFDEQNRWIKRTRSNGRVTARSYMCSGDLLNETDENGVTTTYGYDSARQLVEVIRSAVTDGETVITPEIITSYTRDAQGRILQTRVDTGAMTTQESTEYDLLGRVTSRTDALGHTTTYAYSVDGLTTTVTTPSGATLVTRRHPDGSVLEESGTGQRHLIYQTDSVSDGIRQTTLIPARQEGEADTIMSRQITDGFGQGIRTAQAATDADTFIYDRQTYDTKGQLVQNGRDTGTGEGALSMAPTLYEYDNFGNVVKEILLLDAGAPGDPAKNSITTYAYAVEQRDDGVYRITTTTKNNGKGTTYAESAATLLSESATLENKTVITDPRGNVATAWTEYGTGTKRIQKNTVPTSAITATVTVIDGFSTAQTDHAGVTTTQMRAFTATGITLTRTDGRGNATTTKTDIAGRAVSVTDAAGNNTTTAYSLHFDQPATITDALGNTAYYKYDIRGRKTTEWGTGIQPALFAYDDADRMTSLTTFRADESDITTDPGERTDGDTTTWQYHDATGLLLKKTYEDGTHEDTAYNALNLKATLTDPRGIVTTCTYETARGLLTGETYSDDATPGRSYGYNHLGLMTQIVDASGTRTITYTAYNEPESESLEGGGKTHSVTELRDGYGRSTGYTYVKGESVQQTTGIGYGTDGRIATASFMHGGASKSFGYEYQENSHLLQSLSMPNNMTLTRAYEEKRDLVASMTCKRATTTVVNRGYTYDALARPVTRTTARKGTIRNDAFTYNSRSELAAATLGTDAYGYGYDNIGNRKTAQELAKELTYASNNLNQYTSITRSTLNSSPSTLEEPFVPTYDANGNQTLVKTATGLWTVQYDANNRPVSFTKAEAESTTVVECGYDYMGRRYMKKVTVNGTVALHHRYIYRGYLQVACCDLKRSAHPCLWLITWDPTDPVATHPLASQKDGTWYCYGHDITKNVEIFGSSGYIRTAYDYTPYGGVVEEGDVAQPVQWSSEMYDDELALVYYNYRHYNPTDGRWISRDPIAEDGGWNLYVFVNNSCWVMDGLGRYPAALDKGILPRPADYRNDPRKENVKIVPAGRMTIYGLTVTSEIPKINELYDLRAEIKCILIKDDLLPQHPRIDVTYFYDKNYNPQDPRSGYRDRQGRNVIEHENVHVSIEIEEWNSLIGKLEETRSRVFRTEEETRTAYLELIEKRQDYNVTTTQRHAAHDVASGSPQH